MKKGKQILFKFLIVLISVYFIDGGRSMMLVSNNIQILFSRNHANDFEVPHQHHILNFSTEEKWLDPSKFDFIGFNHIVVKFLFNPNLIPQEFPDSIWQPPKFV